MIRYVYAHCTNPVIRIWYASVHYTTTGDEDGMSSTDSQGGAAVSATRTGIGAAVQDAALPPRAGRLLHVHGESANLLATNDVPEDKLLNVIGGDMYRLLRNLVAPDNPVSLSITEITETIRKHFEPKPSLIAEHHQIHRNVHCRATPISPPV
jgi:hypothetical protein